MNGLALALYISGSEKFGNYFVAVGVVLFFGLR